MARARDARTTLERAYARFLAHLVGALALRQGRRADGSIVLVTAGPTGNLSAFERFLGREHPDVTVTWFAQSSRQYREIRDRGTKVLSAHRLRDVWQVARSSAIMTAAGPGSLKPWLGFRHRPLFLDAWHGVGFKSRFRTARNVLRSYDAHLVSSPFVAEYYRRHGGSPVVTGYARMDDLLQRDPAREQVDRGTAARSKSGLVLFAPTWGCPPAPGMDDRTILEELDRQAPQGITIAYRPHPYAPRARVDDLDTVVDVSGDRVTDASDLLARADVLVTDWSSIAIDFLALGRPIIYRDAAAPADELGPMNEHDRPGPLATDARSLAEAVVAAVRQPEAHVELYGEAAARTLERAWGHTLDGRSAERYLNVVRTLLSTGPATGPTL